MTISEKIIDSFKGTKAIKATAREVGCSWMRVVKVLSSNNIIINDTHREILLLYEKGTSVGDIAKSTGLNIKTVKAYLPAVRPVYGEDLSANAERIKKCRNKKSQLKD